MVNNLNYRMRNTILIIFFLSFFINVNCQAKRDEFAGMIKFNHKIISKEKDYDVNNDYSVIGRSSDYYFKDGNIKWLTYDSYFKMNLFVAKENRDYYLFSKSDTIFTLKNNIRDFDIVEYKITPSNEIILGHKCKMLQLTLKPLDNNVPITYRRYYFSNEFYIDPEKLSDCSSNAYDVIYGQIRSIPLKIEYEFTNRIIVWGAIEINKLELDNSFFELGNIPIEYR